MIAIPAIDLREGACVQLVGGSYAQERVRLDDPLEVAREWSRVGFSRLHVIDLDAALQKGSNIAVVRELVRQSAEPVQVGGGLRTTAAVDDLLDRGAARVIVGTRALEDADWLAELAEQNPGEIILAADVRERRVVTHGWERAGTRDVFDLLDEIAHLPLAAVLVTAVHREGQQLGSDLSLIEDVVERSVFAVIAAGGVGSMQDLYALENRGAAAVVVGMALYTGALDPRAVAQEFAE